VRPNDPESLFAPDRFDKAPVQIDSAGIDLEPTVGVRGAAGRKAGVGQRPAGADRRARGGVSE